MDPHALSPPEVGATPASLRRIGLVALACFVVIVLIGVGAAIAGRGSASLAAAVILALIAAVIAVWGLAAARAWKRLPGLLEPGEQLEAVAHCKRYEAEGVLVPRGLILGATDQRLVLIPSSRPTSRVTLSLPLADLDELRTPEPNRLALRAGERSMLLGALPSQIRSIVSAVAPLRD